MRPALQTWVEGRTDARLESPDRLIVDVDDGDGGHKEVICLKRVRLVWII
jgi:hypothetical protein